VSRFDSERSLPFNQICRWFAGNEAERIIGSFKKYDTGKSIKDIECSGCLDLEIWSLEIYNHGRYSSVTKDAYGLYEPFIDTLFLKVELNKKNGYQLRF
jgi:hypothetical protein